MKKLSFLILLSVFALTGCKEDDPCENITCLNDGYCANGSCVCPEGYEGSDCSQQETPSKITITKIIITNFPATDNGAGWDLTSGPELYPTFSKDNTVIWKSESYYTDADPVYAHSFTLSEDITEPTDRYAIKLYDYDTSDDDDYMGGIEFTPYTNTNGFPAVKTLSVGSIIIDVYLSYTW